MRFRTGNDQRQDKVELVARIFEEYGDLIRAIINLNLSDQRSADDIYQDSFLSLIHKPVPEDTENIQAYLYRVITNDIIDAARRTTSYRSRVGRYAKWREYDVICEGPENIVIRAEERREVFRLIEEQLPPREAEAMMERFEHGKSINDAAEIMCVNKRTLSHYVCTGVKKIRSLVKR